MAAIKLQFEVEFINIQVEKYTQAVKNRVRELLTGAAKAFLQAAAPRVRVRTGFAHGSFGNLAKFLRTSLPAGRPGTTPRKKGEFYRAPGIRLRKTPTSGQPFATPPNDIIRVDREGNVTFNYNIDIRYFLRNDTLGHPAGYSPWESYREGFFAFFTYVQENQVDVFPDLEDFATVVRSNVT